MRYFGCHMVCRRCIYFCREGENPCKSLLILQLLLLICNRIPQSPIQVKVQVALLPPFPYESAITGTMDYENVLPMLGQMSMEALACNNL